MMKFWEEAIRNVMIVSYHNIIVETHLEQLKVIIHMPIELYYTFE